MNKDSRIILTNIFYSYTINATKTKQMSGLTKNTLKLLTLTKAKRVLRNLKILETVNINPESYETPVEEDEEFASFGGFIFRRKDGC